MILLFNYSQCNSIDGLIYEKNVLSHFLIATQVSVYPKVGRTSVLGTDLTG